MVGPAAKRAAVAHLQAVMSLSERRACSIVDADRKMIRYRSTRAAIVGASRERVLNAVASLTNCVLFGSERAVRLANPRRLIGSSGSQRDSTSSTS